jgi:hypothetical protein
MREWRFAFSLGMFAHAESRAQLYHAVVGSKAGASVIVQGEIQQILADLVYEERGYPYEWGEPAARSPHGDALG